MNTTINTSLLNQDVRRRESVRSMVGWAWGRLHNALGASTQGTLDVENQDDDVWMTMNEDEGSEHAGYSAIDEDPAALSSEKTTNPRRNQENVSYHNTLSSELEGCRNTSSGVTWARSQKENSTPAKRCATSGYVAFA